MNLEKIRYIREILDLTQREMADKLNVSKSTYGRWETGEKIIPLKHLVKLCNLANITLDYALGITNENKKTTTKIVFDMKNVAIKIKEIRKINSLTQEQFASSINVARTVISNYEHNRFPIQTAFIIDICRKYNVSADWILDSKQ